MKLFEFVILNEGYLENKFTWNMPLKLQVTYWMDHPVWSIQPALYCDEP
jgi:hypothetical protein